MGPKTALSCSLLLCYLVDVGICLSSGEKNFRTPNSALIVDIVEENSDGGGDSSGIKFSPRFKRVSNKDYNEEEDEEDDVDGAPPDHQVPYSVHENPEEPSTKPKYVKPGDWAKPSRERNVPLKFVPTKLYAQVRGTHTVKRAPRAEALATAETAEEILSAPRLREVVSKSKKNTIYTEEGYEDSAYDHAGHIRDADFHEGFAKKLDEKRKSKQNSKFKTKSDEEEELENDGLRNEEEELNNEESHDDEEFNEYDDDYRDHAEESARVEKLKPSKQKKTGAEGEKNKNVKGLLRNSDINPKHVTENEIVRLEEDLEREYAESEKNVEDEVPENLKNSGKEGEDEEETHSENLKKSRKDDEDEEQESQSENSTKSGNDGEDEAEESKNEEDFRYDYNYGKRVDKNIDANKEASRDVMRSQSGGRKFGDTETSVVSSTQPANIGITSTPVNPTVSQKATTDGFTVYKDFQTSQNPAGDFSSTTPNYGKVFWNYFKLVGDHWKPQGASTSRDITTTMTEAATLFPEEITSVPTFISTPSKLKDTDNFSRSPPTTFSFTPSVTELNDFVFSSTNMASDHPRSDSVSDSWKRQDGGINSEERLEIANMKAALDSYSEEYDSIPSLGKDLPINMIRDEMTTLMSPKKPSYTVIIRPKDKSITTSPPCDHELHNRSGPTNSIGQSPSPKYKKMMKYLENQPSPQEINNIAVKHQDFTVIQPPLSVPLRQVTYNDFPPDTYDSSKQQSVAQESGELGKKLNGGRDGYHGSKTPYDDKRYSKVVSHASEVPHFHHHHSQQSSAGHKKSHLHPHVPPTKLLPPSPLVRSSYAEYLSGNRLPKHRTRFDRSPRLNPWDSLLELYRTIDRNIFGKRKKRSPESDKKIEQLRDVESITLSTAANQRGKVKYRGFDAPSEKSLPKRNFIREGANRLVAIGATAMVKVTSDGIAHREKISTARRRRNHEELLEKSPEIAEEVINAEIESRFSDDEEDDEEEEEENYNDSEDKQQGKVDVEVPDFDVAEVIKQINDNENEKIIRKHPTEANKLDIEKYPFYDNSKVPQSSALKYITNPRQVPRKTLGGTEFYDSRDKYLECDEVEPNLEEVVPKTEQPMPDREQQGDEPRLHGLGDKLDCFRAKYFDNNPLDNPLFFEGQIDQPRAPEEFNPAKFASRIFKIPTKDQVQREAVVRASRRPEFRDLRRSGSSRNQITHKNQENTRQENTKNHERKQEEATKNLRNRRKRPERRGQKTKTEQTTIKPPQYYPVAPYERQVYDDVMGTIKNLAGLYQAYGEPVLPPLVPTNFYHVPADRETNWNYPVRLTDRPRSFLIRGSLPPQTTVTPDDQHLQKYRAFPYRTNKVSYRTRVRTESPPGVEGIKIGYFKTVRVHKRSVDDTKIPEELDKKKLENIETDDERNLTTTTSFEKTISGDTGLEKKLLASKVSGNPNMKPEESGNIISGKKISNSSSIEKSLAKNVPKESDLDNSGSRNVTESSVEDFFSSSTSNKNTTDGVGEEKGKISAAKKFTTVSNTNIKWSGSIVGGSTNNLTTTSSAKEKKASEDAEEEKKLASKKVPDESNIKRYRNIVIGDKKKLPISFPLKKNTSRERKKESTTKKIPKESDLETEESRNFRVRSRKNLTRDSTLKNKKTQDIEKQEKPAASERVIYTIRDRIRHSKPRNGFGINRKFANLEAAETEDIRRREPRYKQIQRKKVSSSTIDPSTNSGEEQVEEEGLPATALKRKKTTGRQDFHDEPGEIYKIQFSTTRGTQTAPAGNKRRDDEKTIDDEEDQDEEKQSEESRNADTEDGNYAVRENVENDVTTVSSLDVEPTETPEYRKLRKYLESEPPGYYEAFNENSAESDPRYNTNKNNGKDEEAEDGVDDKDEEPPTKSYQRAETRREDGQEQEAKEGNEQGDKESRGSSESEYNDEESSEKSGEVEDGPESPMESESYKNADDEDTKNISDDDESEFDQFASRPFSPYESFYDPKYSDLGPRLDKPAFHHPSFSKSTSSENRRGDYSAESEKGSDEEGSEKTSRYIFPWEQDEAEDAEETKATEHSIGTYEYPWEKRERLAKERRKKEKARRAYEKLFTLSDDSEEDEDEDEEPNASNTKLQTRRIYPWDYDVPSRNHHRAKISRNGQPTDNIEVGTEYRPITKFSSRYKSKIFNLHDEGDPIVVSGADPSQIRGSVIESIKKASETKLVDPTQVLKNILQPNTTIVATGTANSYRVPGKTSSTAPRRLRNWKKTPPTSLTTTIAPTTTILPIKTSLRSRTSRIVSTTTKKPIRTRKRPSSLVDNEVIKSRSQKKEILATNLARINDTKLLTISPLNTVSSSASRRKIRQRGQINKRPHNSTLTTARSVRRRLSKLTALPEVVDETAMKTFTDRTTTPKSKTVEHRSSFSKEEIITKTSYPRFENNEDEENGNGIKNKDYSKNERKGKDSKKGNNMMNESVKKISIVRKETPEHIFRTEEVDKDGVKGMFVSITPNNGSSLMNSMEDPKDRPKDDEDTKEMMKRFRDFDEKEHEQDADGSIIQNSHMIANLLRQVPPLMNDLTYDENYHGEANHFLEPEGSEDVNNDEDNPDHAKLQSRITYDKDPNNRLYYYVEK